jgi:hypothetical protein
MCIYGESSDVLTLQRRKLVEHGLKYLKLRDVRGEQVVAGRAEERNGEVKREGTRTRQNSS